MIPPPPPPPLPPPAPEITPPIAIKTRPVSSSLPQLTPPSTNRPSVITTPLPPLPDPPSSRCVSAAQVNNPIIPPPKRLSETVTVTTTEPVLVFASNETVNSAKTNPVNAKPKGLSVSLDALGSKEIARLEAKRIKEEERDRKRVKNAVDAGSSGTLNIGSGKKGGVGGIAPPDSEVYGERRRSKRTRKQLMWIGIGVLVPCFVLGVVVTAICLYYYYFLVSVTVKFTVAADDVNGFSAVAKSDASTLSLKYIVRSVKLCDTVYTSTVGTEAGPTCLSLFTNNIISSPVSEYTLANAKAEFDPRTLGMVGNPNFIPPPTAWTNFLSPYSINLLTSTKKFTMNTQPTTYNFILVEIYNPIKLVAKINLFPSTKPTPPPGIGYVLATRGIPDDATEFSQTPTGGLYTAYTTSLLEYETLNGTATSQPPLKNQLPRTPYFGETIIPSTETELWYPLSTPITLSLGNGGFQRRKVIVNMVLDEASQLMQGVAPSLLSKNQSVEQIPAGNLIDGDGNAMFLPPPQFSALVQGGGGDVVGVERYLMYVKSQNVVVQISLIVQPSGNGVNWLAGDVGDGVAGVTLAVVPGSMAAFASAAELLAWNVTTVASAVRGNVLIVPKIAGIVKVQENTYQFLDVHGIVVLGNFKRSSGVRGVANTAWIRCGLLDGTIGTCLTPTQTEDVVYWPYSRQFA